MPLSRRTFLKQSALASCLGALPQLARSEIAIGQGKLVTVSDGMLTLPGSFIFEPMPKRELLPVLQEFDVSPDQLRPECNLALYQDGDRNILFDVGSGPDFMPTAGKIQDSLAALGLAPEDITHVVFTHAHPDHIWGLLDDFDDPLFYEASYLMGRQEWDYWWNPNTVNEIGDARAAFAVGAKRRMEAIADQVTLFDDGDEILPGVAAIASPGHTPGHMAFEIGQSGQSAMIVGDAIGNHHVAFRKPEWHSGSDQDADQAAKTRTRLLDRLTHEKTTLVGFHLPGGGIGHAERRDGSYHFVGL